MQTREQDQPQTPTTGEAGPRITIEPLIRGRYRLECVLDMPAPPGEVFPFFADAHNLQAITPPSLRFNVVTPRPIEMVPGAIIDYRLRLRGVPFGWRTRIPVWAPPHRFVDEQLRGPYAEWHHEHIFEPIAGGTATRMTDRVDYKLPFGPLGLIAHRLFVGRELRAIFRYRSEQIAARFSRGDHTEPPERTSP